MAEQDQNQERTEEPTAKRKKESREKGQVARSRELNILTSMLFSGLGFLFMGGVISIQIAQLTQNNLSIGGEAAFDPSAPIEQLGSAISDALFILMPFGLMTMVVALIGPLVMGGVGFSWSSIKPSPEKIDPIKGLARIFSVKSLVELVKSLIKVIMIGGCAWAFFAVFLDDVLNLWQLQVSQAISLSSQFLVWELLLLCIAMIVVTMVDVPFQLWDHNKKLRMTLQEVKDELKETEGRPEVKGKIKQLQREISQNRMIADVPDAAVVITNPSHFAVAIRYDIESGGTPVVVAKGQDLIAAKIRLVAETNDVPICELPPLARALFWNVEIGSEIPRNLYLAVARVLAYVFHLNTNLAASVPFPSDIEIPEEYWPDIERGRD